LLLFSRQSGSVVVVVFVVVFSRNIIIIKVNAVAIKMDTEENKELLDFADQPTDSISDDMDDNSILLERFCFFLSSLSALLLLVVGERAPVFETINFNKVVVLFVVVFPLEVCVLGLTFISGNV